MKTKLALIQRAALLLLLSTIIHQPATAFAQTQEFTYQGRLNVGGAPANGSYDLTFKVYDAATNGAVVAGAATNAAVAISNGLFTVGLNFGGAIFNGAYLWLEIAARTNSGGAFTVLSPRQEIKSVPYALFSTYAAEADTAEQANIVNASGITGTILDSSLPASPSFSGAVTAGSFSGNGGSLTNLNSASLSGTILNSSLPANPNFSGTVTASSLSGNGAGVTNVNGTNLVGSVPDARLSANVALRAGGNTFAGNQIVTNGNVGIGTNAPQANLHVVTAGEGIRVQGNSSGVDNVAYTTFVNGGGTRIGYVGDGSTGDDGIFLDADSGPIVLNTASGRSVTVATNGNVGIGTNNPTHKLHVVGSARVNGFLNVSTLYVDDGPTGFPIAVTAAGNDVFQLVAGFGGPILFLCTGQAIKTVGGTSWIFQSDKRLKQDVRPFEAGLNEILQLQSVRFRYRDDPKRGLTSDHEEVGFIAQEVREVIPDAVTEDKDGYLSLTADPIHWAAINAIQELNRKVETGDKKSEDRSQKSEVRIQKLEAENAELKQRLEKLERLVTTKQKAGQ